jgi:hypothetical protein
MSCEGQLPDQVNIGRVATNVAGFAVLSGVGLTIDLGVFSALVHYGLRPGYANLVSATLAVTFVYFSSAKRIFRYSGRFLLPLFLLYVAYQLTAVLAASIAVDRLVLAGFKPIITKFMILPVTFTANYLFISFILKAKN